MTGAPRELIVEDDPAWREILAEILADMGLAVDIAEGLDAAVASLREAPHRLAVVDFALRDEPVQDQDGLRVLEAVRRHDPRCVAVLLTGFATVELAVSALTEYGAYTCLRKEAFRRAEFRELVGRILAMAPAQRPSPHDAALPGPPGEDGTARGAEETAELALLVEDDASWRGILAELLGDVGYSVRACAGFGEALGYLRRERYAVAVVDLSLASSVDPGSNRDGYRVLARARSAGIPAIVVSGLATPADVERAYAGYGIFAYLEKQGFDRPTFRTVVTEAASAGKAPSGEIDGLTPREREVVALLVQGLTNKGIAHAMVISTNTVKRYLKSIFEKLDVDSRAAAVAKAVTAGVGEGTMRRGVT